MTDTSTPPFPTGTTMRSTPPATVRVGIVAPPARSRLELDIFLSVLDAVGPGGGAYEYDEIQLDAPSRRVCDVLVAADPATGGEGEYSLDALGRIADLARTARLVVGLGRGAVLLATAGALLGRRATTHRRLAHLLAGWGVDYVESAEALQDGKYLSTGSVSAAADAGVLVVAATHGVSAAQRIAAQLRVPGERQVPGLAPAAPRAVLVPA